MYAAAHADHLAGLILDGTLDLTLEGVKQDERQMKGFQTALDATLKECAAEPACKTDFGGDDPAKVYDDMAASLSKKPQAFEFPLADGTKAQRLMTLSKLESAATYAMYSRATRMILMRSLAAAHRGDFVPLARLFYGLLNYSPASEKWTGDPTFSDTDFYAVGCTDNNYFTGTADERAKAIIQESKGSYGTDARLDEGLYSELICIDWPTSPDKQVSQPPLKAPGVPTLVLNATLDPATPFQGGKDVASRLEDGYHIYVEGGEHGSYANDEKCPDDAVTNLLVYGEKPAQRETKCSWSQPVMWSYLTPAPADAKTAGDNMLLFMFSTDIDILLIPEHAFSKPDQGKTEVACPYGGKFNFDLDKKTKTEAFTFAACEFSKGFAMTGTGSFNVKTGDRTYEIDISGTAKGNLTYKFIRDPQSLSITGTYGGKTINIQR
jgi:pimeloyl-ACP methyl ester carboxylesterase